MVNYGLKYAAAHKPQAVVLENVAGLVKNHPTVYKHIIRSLRSMGHGFYKVSDAVLNTADHGLPQSRTRLYVVALSKACLGRTGKAFVFPQPRAPLPLCSILDMSHVGGDDDLPSDDIGLSNLSAAMEKLVRKGANPTKERPMYVADIYCGKGCCVHCTKDRFPCITASRASAKGFWLCGLQRLTNLKELMMLQGVNPGRLNTTGISHRQLGMMCGNAMSINVLTRLFARILPIISDETPEDPWD